MKTLLLTFVCRHMQFILTSSSPTLHQLILPHSHILIQKRSFHEKYLSPYIFSCGGVGRGILFFAGKNKYDMSVSLFHYL
jgi:hypothetical protein